MTVRLSHIWRHPIKSHGREALERVAVTAGKTLPWDRHWAVAHDMAKTDGSEWAPCANFSRGAKAPALMAINAQLDEAKSSITLTHPDRPDLTFQPDQDSAAFLDWVRPLMPEDRAQSARILSVVDRGMTDTPFPSISLGNLASLRALSAAMGQEIDPRRFRANLWVDGMDAWSEFELVGKDIRIGDVTFHVEERIERCLATTANPDTGKRDADTLTALETGWNHRDFGVYLTAKSSGQLATGGAREILS